MKRIAFALVLFLVVPAVAEEGKGPSPYPTGSSSQNHAGLRFQIVIPGDYDPAKKYALMVVLHGAGGTETGMAASLQPLAEEWFVVFAPKSREATWTKQDLEDVKTIIGHLTDVLSIDEGHLHGMGFSNGGWNLAPLVFDEELRFSSACWMAAGFNGGKVPARAKKEMGAIALVGASDPNRKAAEQTVEARHAHIVTGLDPGAEHRGGQPGLFRHGHVGGARADDHDLAHRGRRGFRGGVDHTGIGRVLRLGNAGAHRFERLLCGPGAEQSAAPGPDALGDVRHLLGRLALPQDHLRESAAQPAAVIHDREAEILRKRGGDRLERVGGRERPLVHRFEDLEDSISIHGA